MYLNPLVLEGNKDSYSKQTMFLKNSKENFLKVENIFKEVKPLLENNHGSCGSSTCLCHPLGYFNIICRQMNILLIWKEFKELLLRRQEGIYKKCILFQWEKYKNLNKLIGR